MATTLVKNPSKTEGMWIHCRPAVNQIEFGVSIHPNSSSTKSVVIAGGAHVWFYATMVWRVEQPIVIYTDGQHAAVGHWETGPGFATEVNTAGNLAFGLQYTDVINPINYGKGYIDAVKMFNRPLSAAEVQILYNRY